MTDDAREAVPTAVEQIDIARRLLLVAGWAITVISLFAPGFYRVGHAWSAAKTFPAFAVLLRAFLAGFEPHNLRLGWLHAASFLSGWLVLAGSVVFALSPLLLGRGRTIGAMPWLASLLLAVWLPPLLEWLDHRTNRWYLWGYYGVAVGFTLVFLALVLPTHDRRRWRGFEPVVRSGGR